MAAEETHFGLGNKGRRECENVKRITKIWLRWNPSLDWPFEVSPAFPAVGVDLKLVFPFAIVRSDREGSREKKKGERVSFLVRPLLNLKMKMFDKEQNLTFCLLSNCRCQMEIRGREKRGKREGKEFGRIRLPVEAISFTGASERGEKVLETYHHFLNHTSERWYHEK